MAPASDWRSWEAAGRIALVGRRQRLRHPLSGRPRPAGRTRPWGHPVERGLVPHHARGRPDRRPCGGGSRRILDAAAGNGVAVWAALHDLAVPGWFLDEGGFADDRARIWWSRWVELAADLVGDRVAGWFPLLEPVTWAADGYLRGITPRASTIRRSSPRRCVACTWPGATPGGSCAVADRRWPRRTASSSVHAADATVPARQQARLADELLWGSWVSGLRDGLLRVPAWPRKRSPT